MNSILKILTTATPQKYSKYDGVNSVVLILTYVTLLTFTKNELWLHENMHIQFYVYLFFQIHIFTLNSRGEQSKQNTHLNGRKLAEDANMTLV